MCPRTFLDGHCDSLASSAEPQDQGATLTESGPKMSSGKMWPRASQHQGKGQLRRRGRRGADDWGCVAVTSGLHTALYQPTNRAYVSSEPGQDYTRQGGELGYYCRMSENGFGVDLSPLSDEITWVVRS